MLLRMMTERDFQRFWPVFQGVIAAQGSYAFAPDMTLKQGWQLWGELPLQTWVVEEDGELLGSYFLKANAAGPGSHVANCGYMVAPAARGRAKSLRLLPRARRV